MIPSYVIRPKYIKLVERYVKDNNPLTKIQKKHKFIHWLKIYQSELTDAEKEYLQECICKVNLID